ncbi:hypothetical protein [Photobacterium alginatilyticum]|uniref:Uncharacterized protein n=1 Tax=Photobacterium alginatilyticum TaxID=1775171 RepID=A0ABW9YNR3_9GAMM|nr:hypothetical protein [Photobacterium alginatilyticum]NBI55468.1 hypothetical protein [Photobacterium alginatilyticum]
MENQQHIVTSPIHRPCPDMAGCSNPDPKLLKKSLAAIEQLREKFNFKTAEERQAEEVEYKHYIAGIGLGGAQ